MYVFSLGQNVDPTRIISATMATLGTSACVQTQHGTKGLVFVQLK
jgi:hypothetical protein